MARDFGGSAGQSLQVGGSVGGDGFQSTRWTAGGWVNLDSVWNNAAICMNGYATTPIPIGVALGGDIGTPGNWIAASYSGATWRVVSDTVAASSFIGRWTHIMATYDNDTLKLFRDGKVVVSTSVGASSTSSGREFCVGKDWNDNEMDGKMAEVVVWTDVLTELEVFHVYQGISPRFIRPSSIAAYWPLSSQYETSGGAGDVMGRRPLTTVSVATVLTSQQPPLFVPEVTRVPFAIVDTRVVTGGFQYLQPVGGN